jgi:hypothetical protein
MSCRTLRSHSKRAKANESNGTSTSANDAKHTVRPSSAMYAAGKPFCCHYRQLPADINKCLEESKRENERLVKREKERWEKLDLLITPTLRKHLDRAASRKRKRPAVQPLARQSELVRMEELANEDHERRDQQLKDVESRIMKEIDDKVSSLITKTEVIQEKVDHLERRMKFDSVVHS